MTREQQLIKKAEEIVQHIVEDFSIEELKITFNKIKGNHYGEYIDASYSPSENAKGKVNVDPFNQDEEGMLRTLVHEFFHHIHYSRHNNKRFRWDGLAEGADVFEQFANAFALLARDIEFLANGGTLTTKERNPETYGKLQTKIYKIVQAA